MTALKRLQVPQLPEMPPASRKDLLGVSHAPGRPPMSNCSAWKWLKNLGFEVRQVLPEHWVVTHSRTSPELHFYSNSELSQFAAHRAHHYAETFTREKS
ncbi:MULTISPECIES: hypothetical protein [Marinobacter]|uniref:hypothetical protein n=1 Tax=Marinobacter TaxID=2742 RepID=UPI001244519A|nr:MULTISPECIES: hypothetical protein [Marinobacter]MBL3557591.1 hypothetical protein [Marinobacter sp. JB05H06]